MGRTRDTSKILKELDERIFISSASPSNNIDGRIWVDTTTASSPVVSIYGSGAWRRPSIGIFSAVGGNIISINGYQYHTFTSSGNFDIISGQRQVEYLIVAGGGGGGCDNGGGGGAGGYLTGSILLSQGTYSISIGGGGNAATSASVKGSNGGNSSFSSIQSIGGGGGGSLSTTPGSSG
jgi:hypothetical protein